jgi:hypothetical protein
MHDLNVEQFLTSRLSELKRKIAVTRSHGSGLPVQEASYQYFMTVISQCEVGIVEADPRFPQLPSNPP